MKAFQTKCWNPQRGICEVISVYIYTLILEDNAFQMTHTSRASTFVTGIEGIWSLQTIKHRHSIRTLITGSLSLCRYSLNLLSWTPTTSPTGLDNWSVTETWDRIFYVFLLLHISCRILQGFAENCLFDHVFDICETIETWKCTWNVENIGVVAAIIKIFVLMA